VDSVDSIVANTRLREWQVPTTVGVSGPIGHGKSTVARMLGEKFGHTEIAFADHLRDVCNTLLGVPFIALTDRTLKNAPLVGSANGHVLPFDLRDPVALNAQIDRTLALAYFTTYEIFANAETAAGVVKVGGGDLEPARVRRGVQMLFRIHVKRDDVKAVRDFRPASSVLFPIRSQPASQFSFATPAHAKS